MKKTLEIILFFVILTVIASCDTATSNRETAQTDSIKQIYKNNYNDYMLYRDIFLSKYKKLYEIIKNNKLNDSIYSNFIGASIFESTIITGMYYDEKILYEAVILFYLKAYYANLKNEYLINFCDDMWRNSYLTIFYVIYVKISNEPPDKGFVIADCYNWVKKQPKYLKNPDIKAITDSIDFILSRK